MRMRTSPAWGGSTTTVATSRGFLASQAMAALQWMGLPAESCSSSMRRRWVAEGVGSGSSGGTKDSQPEQASK